MVLNKTISKNINFSEELNTNCYLKPLSFGFWIFFILEKSNCD